MKKHMRLGLLVMALIATLLATGAAAQPPDGKPFSADVYICDLDPEQAAWYIFDDTVWNFRNLVYETPMISEEEPRMHGTAVWRGNQDLDLLTGNGRAWTTGIIETEEGTWRAVAHGVYTNGVVSAEGQAHGTHGLEGQKAFWVTTALTEIPSEDPCPDGAQMALNFTGYILEH